MNVEKIKGIEGDDRVIISFNGKVRSVGSGCRSGGACSGRSWALE
jgi:hypothetical protein